VLEALNSNDEIEVQASIHAVLELFRLIIQYDMCNTCYRNKEFLS